jgi:hypothetical protein
MKRLLCTLFITLIAVASVPAAAQTLRKDAERYRWLREHFRFANDSMRELWFDPVLEPNDSGVPDDLDQEIDHAMSGANADVTGLAPAQEDK